MSGIKFGGISCNRCSALRVLKSMLHVAQHHCTDFAGADLSSAVPDVVASVRVTSPHSCCIVATTRRPSARAAVVARVRDVMLVVTSFSRQSRTANAGSGRATGLASGADPSYCVASACGTFVLAINHRCGVTAVTPFTCRTISCWGRYTPATFRNQGRLCGVCVL